MFRHSLSSRVLANIQRQIFTSYKPLIIVQGQQRWHGGHKHIEPGTPMVTLKFYNAKKTPQYEEIKVPVGINLLDVAHDYGLELEGACEGVCACATCHVVLPDEIYDTREEASEDEEDMLDMAFGLTDTSRLGCQIIVTEDMDGIVINVPSATRNFYVDGHVPVPH
mmetsp:Transcript_20068/g.24596  ORF Transcript_20068/g.24596 Transcript_20068/m.24596 type:complete len:166 (+) Transcript_20068:52-549(+)|eukprot:CAMPEP_0194354528 /NCGR_PEP_ID=MMETSP0174-20130528/2675_1 /TAXON_ID=216777 /ORGANISM="Proboscia alata, Strain PI-D3" /LENGTH=165 /DNA_ID=CAMNT_0039123515 /DNA_START=49 /DNA_END=546 /DNA_ORIENTATION=-